MVTPALLASALPLSLAASAVGLLLVGGLIRWPLLAAGLLGGSLVVGQVGRVVVAGQGGGLLVSDVAVVAVLMAAIGRWLIAPPGGRHRQWLTWWVLLLLPFISVSAWSLVVGWVGVWERDGIAIIYWLRLVSYLLLPAALLVLWRDRRVVQQARWWLVGALAVVALVGFLQLWFVPEIAVLGGGWDPHEGRLVATWLDPNFVGVALLMAAMLAGALFATERGARRFVVVIAGVVLAVAVILTQSRSTVVALLLVGGVLSPIGVWQWVRQARASRVVAGLVLVCWVLVGLVGTLWVLGPRAWGLVQGDPTVQVRLTALPLVWSLVERFGWLGVGYNRYQFAAQEVGLIGDFAVHSRAGADSSVLTLWVTTGWLGVGLFILPWLVAGWYLSGRWVYHGSAWAGAAVVSLLLLSVHGQFVNSWLYVQLVVVMSLIVVLGVLEPMFTDAP